MNQIQLYVDLSSLNMISSSLTRRIVLSNRPHMVCPVNDIVTDTMFFGNQYLPQVVNPHKYWIVFF